jgi:hypothetical protein
MMPATPVHRGMAGETTISKNPGASMSYCRARLAVVFAVLMLPGGGALASDAATADTTTVGISLNASILLGLGVSVGTGLGSHFNVRGVYNGYSYSREFDDGESGAYDGTLRLQTFGALADYHPFTGAFRLTAGLLSDGNRITLVGKPTDGAEYDVGDCSYVSSSTDPLRLDGKIDFRSMAPYFGLGWGGNMNAEPGFFGTFDIGIMWAGSAGVSLAASGSAHAAPDQPASCGSDADDTPVADNPEFQRQLAQARADSEDEASNYEFWPSLQFGLGWRF